VVIWVMSRYRIMAMALPLLPWVLRPLHRGITTTITDSHSQQLLHIPPKLHRAMDMVLDTMKQNMIAKLLIILLMEVVVHSQAQWGLATLIRAMLPRISSMVRHLTPNNTMVARRGGLNQEIICRILLALSQCNPPSSSILKMLHHRHNLNRHTRKLIHNHISLMGTTLISRSRSSCSQWLQDLLLQFIPSKFLFQVMGSSSSRLLRVMLKRDQLEVTVHTLLVTLNNQLLKTLQQ
jgi:hypothetical protein